MCRKNLVLSNDICLEKNFTGGYRLKKRWENWIISAEGATAPETLRQMDHCFIKSGERCVSIRRRDNDLSKGTERGIILRLTPYSVDARLFI